MTDVQFLGLMFSQCYQKRITKIQPFFYIFFTFFYLKKFKVDVIRFILFKLVGNL